MAREIKPAGTAADAVASDVYSAWLAQAQVLHAQALSSWQDAMAVQVQAVGTWLALQQELCEQWRTLWDGALVHMTGGVPIDA